MFAFLQPLHRAILGMFVLLIAGFYWVWQQQQPVRLTEVPGAASTLQCVSYAPYYKPGMNPTLAGTQIDPAQIDADLQALSRLTSCVRIYAVAQGLDYVPQAAQKLGMQVILGVWIGWVDADNRMQLETAVDLANQYPEVVRGLIVGNEVLLRGEQTESALRGYLQWAKAHTTVPVTYADVWEFWLKHPALEQDVDFVTVHILPYWEDLPVSVEQGVSHVAAVMDKLAFQFKKPLLIGETGWPSQGRQRFWAKPGLVNEARYLREFLAMAQQRGWQYNVIEAFDQPWKRELEGTVGGYWGMFDTDLQAKFALQGGVAERQDGWWPLFWAGLGTVLGVLWAIRKSMLRPAILLAGLVAANLGLHAYVQITMMEMAARNTGEWLLQGGLVVLGWSLVLLQLRRWLGLKVAACWMQAALLLLAVALLVISASLAVDGRYRDFPLWLVMLPVLTAGLALLTRSATAVKTHVSPHFWLIAVSTVMATNLAVVVAMPEPGNLTAWWWAGLCGLAAVVLPLNASSKA